MTITGLLFIPMCLILTVLPWRYSLVAIIWLSVFAAAAVINAGSIGLQPAYFFALLMIGRTLFELFCGGDAVETRLLKDMLPLFCLVAVAVALLWFAIVVFQGKVYVIGGTDAFNLDRAAPYEFRRENVTQLAYLALNTLTVLTIAHQGAKLGTQGVLECFRKGFILAIIIGIGSCVWQMAGYYAGVPFPNRFFFSNAGYANAHGQVLAGYILRVNGLFSEPSAVAYYFIAFLFFSWHVMLRRPMLSHSLLVFGCVATMLVSTSSTAFVLLGVFVLIVAPDIMKLTMRSALGRGKLTVSGLAAIVALFVTFSAGIYVLQLYSHEVSDIWSKMVLEKNETSSFEQRSGVDAMALEILSDTYGIGIGLRSHKPSSLAMTLLSNVGVVGTLLFIAVVSMAVLPLTRLSPGMDERYKDGQAMKWAFLGLSIAHLISNPNMSLCIYWSTLGYLMAYNNAWRNELRQQHNPSMQRPSLQQPSMQRGPA